MARNTVGSMLRQSSGVATSATVTSPLSSVALAALRDMLRVGMGLCSTRVRPVSAVADRITAKGISK